MTDWVAIETNSTYIVSSGILVASCLDTVGDEAKDGTHPQQQRETAEQLLAELDPLGSGLWRRQLVGAVTLQEALRLLHSQTLKYSK